MVVAFPESEPEALAALSIGRRDGLLLSLRTQLFGPDLVSVASCPGCDERVELDFTLADIQPPSLTEAVEAEQQLCAEPYEVRFRLPNSLDLMAVSDHNESEARQLLLQRCLLQVDRDGAETAAADLPPAVIEAITQRMAAVDAQADIRLQVTCPACQQEWLATFDTVHFFWDEIDVWARRTLQEVHVLASAYGWSETDILKLSAWRRRAYIELVANQ
jgi:hypothetical protein